LVVASVVTAMRTQIVVVLAVAVLCPLSLVTVWALLAQVGRVLTVETEKARQLGNMQPLAVVVLA